jgi:hypothetical protein
MVLEVWRVCHGPSFRAPDNSGRHAFVRELLAALLVKLLCAADPCIFWRGSEPGNFVGLPIPCNFQLLQPSNDQRFKGDK